MDRATRFCRVWLLGVMALLVMVGLFDAVMDPYLVIGMPRIAGLNARKPETDTHTLLAKDHMVARVHPAGLLIGDSKVDIGIDPDSPVWPTDARPVFNYGIPGLGVHGEVAILRHAVSLGGVKRVLVLLEMTQFLKAEDDSVTAPPPIYPAGGLERVERQAKDLLLATLSLDALRASLRTLASQHTEDEPDMTPHGLTLDGGFRAQVKEEGENALFVQKDAITESHIAAMKVADGAPIEQLDAVTAMIAMCRAQGIALDIALAPSHADTLAAFDKHGYAARRAAAKAAIARVVANAGDGTVKLWDFNVYDSFSTEAVPGPRDRSTETRWFWEPSHFKTAFGERLLAKIYGART